MNVISIDPSKVSTGIYLHLDEDKRGIFLCISNKSQTSQGESLANIFIEIASIVNQYKIEMGFIEGYAFNKNRMTSVSVLAEVTGCIRLAFALLHIPLITIPVATWKMIMKMGKIDKRKKAETYLKIGRDRFGIDFLNTDCEDAFFIYKTAQFIFKKKGKMTPGMANVQEELRKALKWQKK